MIPKCYIFDNMILKLAEASYLLKARWLIFALLVPFSEVILITWREHLMEIEGQATNNQVNESSQQGSVVKTKLVSP